MIGLSELESLLIRLREDRAIYLSGEEATCQGVVLPILARLGWDRDNVREVVPQFSVGTGRVDYCLRIGDRSAVFIEVKRVNEDLDQHQEQLLGYAFRSGVEMAVLTNGLSWWLYLPLLGGSWEQRKFFAIDIQQQNASDAARHFWQFLGRDDVASGRAFQNAREVHVSREKARVIHDTLPNAWNQLCEQPDELLLELFAERVEKLCGHRPDNETLAEFLAVQRNDQEQKPGAKQNAKAAPAVFQTDPKTSKPSARNHVALPGTGASFTNTRPSAYTFLGERHAVSTYKEILLGLSARIFELHRDDFDRVFTLRGNKRAYFSGDSDGMKAPALIPGTKVYVETNQNANSMMERCQDLLALFGHSSNDFSVEVQS